MQPTFSSFSDPYTPQFYSSQNPNPNPNPYPLLHHQQQQHQYQYPPAVDPYFRSYAVNHPFSHAIGANTDNWASEEYGNSLYAIGGTIPQDVPQHLLPVIPSQTTWTNQIPPVKPRGPWKKIPKKPKIAQSAWCEICKIECNTKDILYKHKLGKKHIKNVEKLNPAASVATSNPVIGPSENPKKGNVGIKKKAETAEDLEMKRRKVVAGGANADAVRLCGICNVVCNSDAVFRFHLAGQKHASMWKKLQEAGGV